MNGGAVVSHHSGGFVHHNSVLPSHRQREMETRGSGAQSITSTQNSAWLLANTQTGLGAGFIPLP